MNNSMKNSFNGLSDGIIWFLKKIFSTYHGILPFAGLPLVFMLWRRGRRQQNLLNTSSLDKNELSSPSIPMKVGPITIVYSTTTGTAKKLSEEFQQRLQRAFDLNIRLMDLKDYDPDTLENEQIVFFVCSTWTDGTLALSSQSFLAWLEDLANDFRISKMYLEKVKYGIFGLGGKIYGENFCKAVSVYPLRLVVNFL